jgi:co-chaperonin GroES (HSP10)
MQKETLSNSTEIPKTVLGLEEKYKEEDKKTVRAENITDSLIDSLPQPSGWRILVLPFTPKDKTKGGIIFSQESLDKLRISTNCGYVLKMGPLAYHDKERYPTGPWCKEKDWVIFARYAGSRLPIEGGEVRLLNDDEVLGTIKKSGRRITSYINIGGDYARR